jgi:hypothetical protein
MRGRVLLALLSGGSVLLASLSAHAECTKDTDCKGDRVCDAGKCTSPGAATPPATDGAATPVAATPAAAPVAPVAPVAPPAAAPAAATAPLAQDEPQVRRRSRPAMVGGIIMASVGPIALLGALVAKNSQDNCDQRLQQDYPNNVLPPSEKYRVDDCNAYSVPVYIFSIGGALLTAAGIPLIIYGAKAMPEPPKSGSLHVLPWAGPDSGGLRLRLDL